MSKHYPILAWLALAGIWGSTWLFVRIGVNQIPPFTFAWPRFILALLPLGFLILWHRLPFPRSPQIWKMIAITGVLNFTLNYALVYWAETMISSGLAAVIYTNLPLFGIFLAHFMIPNEQLTLKKVLGVLFGIIGVALIYKEQINLGGDGAALGVLLIAAASFFCALAGVLTKKYVVDVNPIVLTFSQISFGVVPLIILGLAYDGNPLQYSWDFGMLASICYLAFMGTAVTFGLLNWLYRHMEVTKTQLLPFAATLIAVLLGNLVLDETLQPMAVIGMCSVLMGLFLGTVRKKIAPKGAI